MINVEVCVGSSCHLKGAPDIVQLLRDAIERERLEQDILLSGSFCTGRCNRVGVTVTVGETVYTGITREGFRDFWENKVLPAVRADREEN